MHKADFAPADHGKVTSSSADGAWMLQVEGHRSAVTSVTHSADGRRLVSGSQVGATHMAYVEYLGPWSTCST
jgi:hypothetical protein